jgi:hypothetical protein
MRAREALLSRVHVSSRVRVLPKVSAPERVRAPVLCAIAACAALAALSAAVLPTVPSYDPWAWIVWGREVFDPHLSFVTGNGPSWKPLPVMFTTVWGLFGNAGPTLWVITARAGGLLGPVAAWRLASRLVRDLDSPLAAPIAGVVAVLGLVLTQDYFYYMFRGTSEPMLIACWLWAIDRLLDRHHAQAYVFLVAAALIRPEAWPFLGLYALWLWLREPRLRLLVVAGLAAIPLFWFVPTKIGSGEWFLAASHAKSYNGHLGAHPVLEALRRAADLQVAPVLVGAAVAVTLRWWRERDRLVLALAGAALAWIVLVVAMVAVGYPGLERFFLPASALLSVLAGAGVARVALLVGSMLGDDGRGRAVAVAVAAAVLAVSIPLSTSRISSARAQKPTADRAVTRLDQLSDAITVVGGHAAVYPCRSSVAAINHAVQTALAWKLHVTLSRVGTVLRHPGVLFVGPHDSIDGGAAPVSHRLTQRQLLAHVGGWYVYRVTEPGGSNDCAGH